MSYSTHTYIHTHSLTNLCAPGITSFYLLVWGTTEQTPNYKRRKEAQNEGWGKGAIHQVCKTLLTRMMDIRK